MIINIKLLPVFSINRSDRDRLSWVVINERCSGQSTKTHWCTHTVCDAACTNTRQVIMKNIFLVYELLSSVLDLWGCSRATVGEQLWGRRARWSPEGRPHTLLHHFVNSLYTRSDFLKETKIIGLLCKRHIEVPLFLIVY